MFFGAEVPVVARSENAPDQCYVAFLCAVEVSR